MSGPTSSAPASRGRGGASAALIAGIGCFVMAAIDLFWTSRFFRLTNTALYGVALWLACGVGLILVWRAARRGLVIAGASAAAKGLLALRAALAGAAPFTFGTLGLLWIASGALAIATHLGRGPTPTLSLRLVGAAALVVGLLAFNHGYAVFSGSASALIKLVVVLRTLIWFGMGGVALASTRREAPTK